MPAYKDVNGTYTLRYYAEDPLTGKRKQVKKRGFTTRKEALKWETENRFSVSPSSSMTFWDMFQKQLEHNDTKRSTRLKKESWIRMHFPYKDMPIDRITKPMLVEWRIKLKESDLAVRTVNHGLQYIRSVYTFYSTIYGGKNEGAVLTSFKLGKDDKTEMGIWTVAQFNTFLSAVNNPTYAAYYQFLFWTGCRRGEGIALTKDCFYGDQVHIYRSMKHYMHGFQPLKTDSSERTIRIDPFLLEVIQPFVDKADPFVFGSVHPLPTSKIDFIFRKAIKESGVDPIRLHDLRHSHASLLLNNGANILAVSKRLGHASVKQTLDTYAHLMKDTEDQSINLLKKAHKKSKISENKSKISPEK